MGFYWESCGRCLAEGGGRVSARRPSYFSLLRQRKVAQRKATPLAVSLRFAAGNLRCSRVRRCRRTHFALTALRSDNCGKSEDEAWASFGAHARLTRCASRHVQRGSKPNTGHRCARPRFIVQPPDPSFISCRRRHNAPPLAKAQPNSAPHRPSGRGAGQASERGGRTCGGHSRCPPSRSAQREERGGKARRRLRGECQYSEADPAGLVLNRLCTQ